MKAPAFKDGALELIGNTPLVRFRRLCPNPDVEIWAKIEGTNPGGSIKDRIALSMINAAEASGELTKDKVILEATSGNTGIGLALVGAVKGYKVVLAMSEAVSQERRQILSALGAEFLLTPAAQGTDGAIELVYRQPRREPGKYYIPDQFNNPANPLAHYNGTAKEIIEQTEGRITHFVASMGTTGTLMGASRRFREDAPGISIIGVEPFLNHKIQGLKNLKEAYRPGIFDRGMVDEKVNIADEDAYETSRLLAREEGLFVGMSSGAAAFVALKKASEIERGVIVVMLPDGGERYLSTTLFQVSAPVTSEPKLELYNTLTRARMMFRPIEDGRVGMYTCGPTVHVRPHLGLLRRMVATDVLRRYLEYSGLNVRHVMNITDIDDKTIEESERQGISLKELTDQCTQWFMDSLDALSVKRAWKYPRASEHVDEMVAFTRRLMDRGFAYEKLRSVYFNIDSYKGYGALSGLDMGKIKVGATVDLDEYEKDDPRDFTLFKRATLGEMARDIFFETDWGNVRPGWHVECAAMS
ncbi:MAG: cysteine synthase, partial [Deltaproteobacteria bacterium]|nr:cysteine synthase [Deltaproteobacteria bacterium]